MAAGPDTYKNLTYVIPEPLTGPGGQALNNNFKYIADRLQSLNNNQLTKISPATAGNIPKLLSSGLLEDSGIPITRLDDVINIPTAVDLPSLGYHLINNGDGTTQWETPASGQSTTITDVDIGTTDVDAILDTAGNSVIWEYVIRNNTLDGNLRAGTVHAVWEESDPDSEVEWYETFTNDIGDTSAVTFEVVRNDTADTITLNAIATSNNWDIKLVRRLFAF